MNAQTKCACSDKHKDRILFLSKTAMLFFCLFLLAGYCRAQLPQQRRQPHMPVRLDPAKDKLEYQGFTIRLIPTIDGYYGYDIFKDNQLVKHQFQSMMPGRPIDDREDAFKAAKWMVTQYIKTGHIPPMIPPGILGPPKHNPSSNTLKP